MAKPNIPPDAGYNVIITGKHFEKSDAVQKYVLEKLHRIERQADRIIDVHVVLDVHKLEHTCSILMNFSNIHIKVHATTENLYSAIDKCTDKLTTLIRKYKGKLYNKQAKEVKMVDLPQDVLRAYEAIENRVEEKKGCGFELHEVIGKETLSAHTMTQDEAVMHMEFSSDPFLVYNSEEDKKMKILYRRKDGNYNVVQLP